MATLEQLQPNASIRGIRPDCAVTVVNIKWFGSEALDLTYKDPSGKVANELLYRHDEPRIELVQIGRPWSFDGDGERFRLVSEAHRIRLAHLFDPVLAVHTSLVDPLPHQITAVYEAMLPRQPLRFLLADDPGASKTIMAGLFIKELIARGDLQRCLVVCPGSLAEQWQDELYRRFQLPFDILTNDKLEAARTGNWFLENNLIIARLDKLSRNEDVQEKLKAPDCGWDLVVCDEAHNPSATFFGGEVKYTKRYRLAQLLFTLTRHLLLMTATPHNGKEEDFQLFMALLDGDRFEGRFRDGVHTADVSDLMRRMVKERLLKFDGTPLFPERVAHTVPYRLSHPEARLYKDVTDYVREEFNRAEALRNDKRAGTVGFALTILQRRLASSPEAINQSLRRRKERLESRLRELELLQRGAVPTAITANVPLLDQEDVEDLEDAPESEVEATEAEILDQATAAQTIDELKAEIATLKRLETLAQGVCRTGEDCKWKELANLLSEIFTPAALAGRIGEGGPPFGGCEDPRPASSPKQKLVVFSEHRDTLSYLQARISTLLGRQDAVVVIHGGLGREKRLKAQEAFKHDPDVQVLVATDAAGEGINLHRAHLMVNYDLPWNPNRLEQRFGRIHRIGQTEVCHLWNFVAEETREGDVYRRLLEKLDEARKALGGQVFDVLDKVHFAGKPLRDLLIEAIRYGELPEVRARLTQTVEGAFDRSQIQDLLEEKAGDAGTASTGWETFLDAVIRAGFSVSGTWPMRTEISNRMRCTASNALASSIVLVCRRRTADAYTTSRREFLTSLKAELPAALAHLQRSNIAPVDLAQAAIGPGMAVYTRYARVLESDGSPLTVRTALALINQVLDEVLAEQEGDFDADTRWALAWFDGHGFDEGDYGTAETLSKAKNTSVSGLVQAGVLASKGGRVRLLSPTDLPEDWDPATDPRLTVWEMVHHLIRTLEAGGESAAAELVGQLGAKAETARELAYRLYTLCERKKRAAEALSYHALVRSWPEIMRLARERGRAEAEQGTLFVEDDRPMRRPRPIELGGAR